MITRLCLASLCLFLLACSAPEEDARRPNVIVLLVDDWGWSDASCLGSDLYDTPNIDALANDGMRFTTSYATCTVCSPTRASMMTGQYPGRTHVTDWIRGHQRPDAKLLPPEWTMKLEARHTTLAEALRAEGYHTATVGKWHLEPTGDLDEDDYIPEKHGFEINVAGNEWGQPPSYHFPYRREGSDRTLGPMAPGGEEGEYLTDRLTDEALKIVDGWADEPFFLYFPYYTVHTPIQALDKDSAPFEARITEGMKHTDTEYAGMLAALDRSVGRIRARLEELGIADNTVILLTGDNGGLDRHDTGRPTENRPLRDGKGSAYEGGVRVPAIVHWPGVTRAGSISDEPIITVDYYPTLLNIVGVEGNAEHNALVDGVNLTPLLRDPSATLERTDLYWHYPHYHSMGATPYSAIRDGDLRLVEFYEDGRTELYDLAADIGEKHDLASERPDKVGELKTKLNAWRERVGAQPPRPNPNYKPE
jgi:arylsulfatase A